MLSYKTSKGRCINGDSLQVLQELEDESIDLVITSPPFALLKQKEYGNKSQKEYVDWFVEFGELVYKKLKPTGSFILDLGGAYEYKKPIRSLYIYRLVLALCDNVGFMLAQDFFWYNPCRLPSPIEYVNKRKIRAKDSVNYNFWFCKNENPKADVRNVLVPYSKYMKKLLKSNGTYYDAGSRPSGHTISTHFYKDNGGAIPSNLLTIKNSNSKDGFIRRCKSLSIKVHPARFPEALPEFYIKFLTDENDLIVDIFAGSNTTGYVAESLNRNWLSAELNKEYFSASVLRFIDGDAIKQKRIYDSLMNDESVEL